MNWCLFNFRLYLEQEYGQTAATEPCTEPRYFHFVFPRGGLNMGCQEMTKNLNSYHCHLAFAFSVLHTL